MEVYTGTFNKESVHRCSNCNIGLGSEVEYKEHYKTEFHRYNLKRRSVNLPPATVEQFEAKKLLDNAKASAPEQKHCDRCNKSFTSEATYQQHLNSRKHQLSIAEAAPEAKPRSSEPAKEKPEAAQTCLFCRYTSTTLPQILTHMSVQHGFFIPQQEYCKDPSGLIAYLQEKVSVGLLCLLCENKGTKDFADAESLRNHMRDKAHCFLKIDEGYEEYEKYYDFGKLFDEKIEQQKGYKKIVGIEEQLVEIQKHKKVEADDWESDSDPSQIDQNEEVQEEKKTANAQPIIEVQQQKGKVKTNKYVFYRPTITRHGELLLPSGKILGHRQYRHLYKQYYRPAWIKPTLNQIAGGDWSMANQIAKRSFETQIVKRENQMANFKRKSDTRHLRMKVHQNMLQYYFRVQNPK